MATAQSSRDKQGSYLSPTILNLFINAFIVQFRVLDVGCYISAVFLGCLLYADAMLIMPSRVVDNTWWKSFNVAGDLSLHFSTTEFYAVFGKTYNYKLPPLYLCWQDYQLSTIIVIKYLAASFVSGRSLKFDAVPIKRACCSLCNSTFPYGAVSTS